MQVENLSSNTEQRNVKKSSSSGFSFFLAILLLLVLCLIVVSATEETKKDIDKKFSDNSFTDIRVEQSTGQPLVDKQIKPLPALTLNSLREKISALSIKGCLIQIDRAIDLYNKECVSEAFLRLQIGLEHLVTQKFEVSLKPDIRGAFMKSARNLKKAGIITEKERKLLCRLGIIRNNIMHFAEFELSDQDAEKYLNRAIAMTDRISNLISVAHKQQVYA